MLYTFLVNFFYWYKEYHCVKSFFIWSSSGQYYPAFELNTERYEVSLCIQSEWRRDTSYLSIFSPNAEKYGLEKLRIRLLFMQCILFDGFYLVSFKKHYLLVLVQEVLVIFEICLGVNILRLLAKSDGHPLPFCCLSNSRIFFSNISSFIRIYIFENFLN